MAVILLALMLTSCLSVGNNPWDPRHDENPDDVGSLLKDLEGDNAKDIKCCPPHSSQKALRG